MSDIPFIKDFNFEYGACERLSPLVRRVIANNPGPYTYSGSGTYMVGSIEGPIVIIDPGPALSDHCDAVVATVGRAKVDAILVTHTHLDHCGGARELSEALNTPVHAFGAHPVADARDDAPALDEGGDYRFRPDHHIANGDTYSGPGWTLTAVHTPGHLSNHLCFALQEEKALFTGDHIMGWATTVVAPPDGDMAAYIESLELLLSRDDEIYYPTHGAPIKNPQAFTRAVRAHRFFRDGQIVEQLKSGRETIGEIVPVMYASVDKRLHPAAALNVYAHLIRLVTNGNVTCDGAPTMTSRYIAI
ncbi:MAG: MBL fold metallo-hydrolase [Pseudomonadota bacterium]